LENLKFISCDMYLKMEKNYVQIFKEKGIGILQSGIMGILNLAYMDTFASFGVIIELFEILKRRSKK